MFYGFPSEHLWEDDFVETHSIPKGEGGRHDATLVPLVNMRPFKWHIGACGTVSISWHSWTMCTWRLTQTAWVLCTQQSKTVGRRQALGSTWGEQRKRARRAFDLERVAQEQNPSARVWRGAGIPVEQHGIKILDTSQRFLNSISEHQTLLRRIRLVGDVQAV